MTNCKVLRCDGIATSTFNPYPDYDPFRAPVCETHEAALRDGQRWILDGDFGVPNPDGSPRGAGYHLLMAADLPPAVTGLSMVRMQGREPGILLTLHTQSFDGPSSVQVWVDPDFDQDFRDIFGSHTTPPDQ